MTTPVLVAHNLSYDVKQARLLNQVSLSLLAGELVGVIGPNGAGKTTLLKALLGYLPATEGTVHIHDRLLLSMPPEERAGFISYLSQEASEGFPFAVFDIVALGAYAARAQALCSQVELQKRVTAVLVALDIGHLASRIFTELSGGEKQLVQFARLLVQDADVMLLDEPTANLDLGHEYELMHALRQQCEQGKSALVTLHNLNIAAEFCDRVILVDQGRIVDDGTPDQVITQEMIQRLYTEHALVVMNAHTGNMNVLPKTRVASALGAKVHIIGGAGSAIRVSKLLRRAGCLVTGGIAHRDDSDVAYWEAAGIAYIETPTFDSISDDSFQMGLAWVASADVTVLCDFPIGTANAKNLALASSSKNVIVMTTHSEQERFFQPAVQTEYDAIVSRSPMVEIDQLLSAINAITKNQ